jgi:uncharacterized circularly permuted ATP-grasp superfamily protein
LAGFEGRRVIHVDPKTAVPEAYFRQLLEEDPAGIRQEHQAVIEELRARRIFFGDQPLPICLAPALITRERLLPIRKEMDRLVRILARLQEPMRQSVWLDRLGISREEQELIQLPNGLPVGGYISRIDGFLDRANGDDTGYRIVELNVDSPGGAAYMDVCVDLLKPTSIWKKFRKRYPGRYLETDKCDLPLMLKSWRAWGGQGMPRVAIVDWVTVNTAPEFELIKERYCRLGVDTIVADPRELEFKDGKLRDYDGKAIDVVYRRVLVEDLLAQAEAAAPLLNAVRAGAVCLVNSFACKPLTVKSLLSQIHSESFESLLPGSDLAFLRRLIPWTTDVTEQCDLGRLRREQEQMVLKPADGYGGQGIYLGWELDAQAWEQAIEVAVRDRYVAQQRVRIPKAEFPVPQEHGWTYESLNVDFDPYMFGRQMADPLVRISAGDVLNVKAGAQIAATWVLD